MKPYIREEIANYRNNKRANEPRYYDSRYGRKFSQSEINVYLIAVFVMQGPIYILAILSLLLNVYGLIFFIFIGIPTLFLIGIMAYYYIKKYITENFYINTDLGKCEIRIKSYKRNQSLYIYFYKVLQNSEIKKNIFSYLLPKNQPKYTRLIIIKDKMPFLRNLVEYMKDKDEKAFSLLSLIKNADLNVEYINLEEKKMGKINVNTAKVSQLSKLPFLGKINAVKVANHIKKNGEFDSIWDFAEFINLPQNKYETLYKYVTVRRTTNNLPVLEQIKQDVPKFDNTLDIF